MLTTVEEFFHDFHQGLVAGAVTSANFHLYEFLEIVSDQLIDTGVLTGIEYSHYRTKTRNAMRVDGYWLDDDGILYLLVADFDSRSELASLTKTDVSTFFKRLASFFNACVESQLYKDLEETSPVYGLSRLITEQLTKIRKLNFLLLSERALSDRVKSLDDGEICGIPVSYNIWDMTRLHRQACATGQKESLDIDLLSLFGSGVLCLPAHIGKATFESYLVVMPGNILSALYEKYDAALLEQNVRCFLQARGKVNKGIRTTLIEEPDRFFAYNNGITATAKNVVTRKTENGTEIINISDFQIVNGGQTTASLFHTSRKDKITLESVFVQMKLSVVESEQNEEFIPKISEYANTQNRISAADFFSNHPFHLRIQDFSRRIWAPAVQGSQIETKWFYERARGQYFDANSTKPAKEQRSFKVANPKQQMFTKTDLAKYENVWDDHPKWVNLGAQKNFVTYAARIAKEWKKTPDKFNEFYFKRVIARAIIFRTTEKLVSNQPWYNGGYRANIVAYSLAAIGEYCKQNKVTVDYLSIWKEQVIPDGLRLCLIVITPLISEHLLTPPQGISNISEYAKKELCWERLLSKFETMAHYWPIEFVNSLIPIDQLAEESIAAKKIQKLDNAINAQMLVLEKGALYWKDIAAKAQDAGVLSEREMGILRIAALMPKKIPTEQQSKILLAIPTKVN